MISRPRALRVLALLAAVGSLAPLPRSAAQEATPVTAAVEITLGTKTPLGEATISIPAGAVVTDFTEDGENITIRRGPFHAAVRRDQLVFAASPPEPEPSPTPEVAPVVEIAAEESIASNAAPPTSAGAALWPWEEGWNGDWRQLWPLAAILVLGLYSLGVTGAFLKQRRRAGVAALPAVRTVHAVVTNEGRSIACPLCGKDIVVEDLQGGRNTCPVCRGSFICERS